MNVMVFALNSYLGKACLEYLPSEDFTIHGIVRDQNLLRSKLLQETKAHLYNLDIFKFDFYSSNLTFPPCDVAFYFTQTPDLYDLLSLRYELLSLRNYIQLAKFNNCNRIVYVGAIYDRKHLRSIEKLFEEFNIQFTIILKNVAVGKGTSFEDFMQKMLKNKFIYLYKPAKSIKLKPITLKDFMGWLKIVDWKTQYIDQYVEYCGAESMELEKVMEMYQEKYSTNKKHLVVPLSNKYLAQFCNKYLSGVSYEQYIEYIVETLDRSDIEQIPFITCSSPSHTILEEYI